MINKDPDPFALMVISSLASTAFGTYMGYDAVSYGVGEITAVIVMTGLIAAVWIVSMAVAYGYDKVIS